MENDAMEHFYDASEEISCTTNNTFREDISFATAPTREERSTAGASASVIVAEPIEDDQDSQFDDSQMPSIRLSSLGTALEKDFKQVQAELGNVASTDSDASGDHPMQGSSDHFSDEFTNSSNNDNIEKGNCHLLQENLASKVEEVSDSNPVTPNPSEEIIVEDLQTSATPHRQRLVSRDGVIAEFDPTGGAAGAQSDESAPDDVVAEAVQIDSSFRSMSMNDLELGDEEPFPYPGRRSSTRQNSSRASNDLYNRSSTRLMGTAIGTRGRAELLSATVIKNSPTEQIGINLLRGETVVYSIARGEEDEGSSLLQNCPFQAGDRLLSVNNKRTQHMESAEVARMLREASGFVTIVVHNPDGDPCLIETMITKANKNQRSGMGLKSTGARDLRVSSINENGLFAQSLLNVGDRILSINEVDVTEVDARVACDIIKNAPDRVTIVARTAHTTGVVVAEVSTRGLRSSFSGEPMLTAVPEAGSPRSNEIEAVDDTFQMTKQQREQVMLGLCLILVVVAVMAAVFGRNAEDNDNN